MNLWSILGFLTLPGPSGGAGSDAFDSRQLLASLLIVVGVVALSIILVRSIRQKVDRRQIAAGTPRERLAAVRERIESKDSVHHLTSNMLDLTQRLSAQLDNKAARLEALLEDAEVVLARLEDAASGAVPPVLVSEAPETPEVHEAFEDDLPDEPEISTVPRAEPQPPAPRERTRTARRDDDDGPPDPLTAAVYQLADDGHQPVQIAQQLDEQVGKVELILALREHG